jgi:cytochrome o ubiquinol oxidase operon protein cyoD
MSDTGQDTETGGYGRELASYLVGYVLALMLTVPLFAAVAFDLASRQQILWATGGAALIQIVVHFRCFMHIRLHGQTREDLQLILFTTLILAIMGGGTIWIIFNLMSRM